MAWKHAGYLENERTIVDILDKLIIEKKLNRNTILLRLKKID
ncbi:hypothetical protein CU016_2116 [Enterococcus lactis]|nr:hypothetical protein [Enterococcus lactis]MBL5015351.1 hypothetical protein [Enterococcus lactis]